MLESGAPSNLWEDATYHLVTTRNAAYGLSGECGHSALFQHRPDISNFMPFFSHVAIYNMDPRDRFDPRAMPARYIGQDVGGGVGAIGAYLGGSVRRSKPYTYMGPPHGKLDTRRMVVSLPPPPILGPPQPPLPDTTLPAAALFSAQTGRGNCWALVFHRAHRVTRLLTNPRTERGSNTACPLGQGGETGRANRHQSTHQEPRIQARASRTHRH